VISVPRLVIAGLGGDTGKTLISTGICRALNRRGLRVVPFKKGPDYIDMGWLARAASHPCYNIDLYMMESSQVLASFDLNTVDADIAVIEGNRGLYDGADAEGSVSTAEVAKLLKTPVVLAVDCTKTTRTVAAIVKGCQVFDPDTPIRGIILNKLGTGRHEAIIRQSVANYCDLPVVGAIPRSREAVFPGRHLGLVPPEEHPASATALDSAAATAEKYLNLEEIVALAGGAPSLEAPMATAATVEARGIRVGVIHDSAFQFYYPENIEALTRAGAEVIEFSALDGLLPSALDLLYIGGGFPETHADALASNELMRTAIKNAAEAGLPVYAECGGLMYLSESLKLNGKEYPMAGVFPITLGLDKRPRGHGYTHLQVSETNPYFPAGKVLRGHEFHYSYLARFSERKGMYFAFDVKKGAGIVKGKDGLCYRNVLATYTHLHALGSSGWVEGILRTARSAK
jgi:cobyrinic acid a,c-diamide synthase